MAAARCGAAPARCRPRRRARPPAPRRVQSACSMASTPADPAPRGRRRLRLRAQSVPARRIPLAKVAVGGAQHDEARPGGCGAPPPRRASRRACATNSTRRPGCRPVRAPCTTIQAPSGTWLSRCAARASSAAGSSPSAMRPAAAERIAASSAMACATAATGFRPRPGRRRCVAGARGTETGDRPAHPPAAGARRRSALAEQARRQARGNRRPRRLAAAGFAANRRDQRLMHLLGGASTSASGAGFDRIRSLCTARA